MNSSKGQEETVQDGGYYPWMDNIYIYIYMLVDIPALP